MLHDEAKLKNDRLHSHNPSRPLSLLFVAVGNYGIMKLNFILYSLAILLDFGK